MKKAVFNKTDYQEVTMHQIYLYSYSDKI